MTFALVAVAAVALIVTREVRSPNLASADPDRRAEIRAALDEDERLSRFDGELNGIRLGATVDDRAAASLCESGEPSVVDFSSASGSERSVDPAYLPDGASRGHDLIVECDGEIIAAEATYFVDPSDTHPYGARILIYRYRGEPRFAASYPSVRVSDVVIADRPGIIVRPVREDEPPRV